MPKPRFWPGTLLLLFLTALVTHAVAAPRLRIYLRNQGYSGPSFVQASQVWIPLTRYVEAMRLQLTRTGNTCQLGDAEHPAVALEGSATPQLFVHGHLVKDALVFRNQELFVATRSATLALGGSYHHDASLGMVDIHGKRQLPKASSASRSPQGASASQAEVSDLVMVHFYANW